MLAGESRRRFLILKCKHAGSASVEMRFERLLVFTQGRMMEEAGARIAIPDQVAVLRIQRVTTEEVRRLNHMDPPPRLLLF